MASNNDCDMKACDLNLHNADKTGRWGFARRSHTSHICGAHNTDKTAKCGVPIRVHSIELVNVTVNGTCILVPNMWFTLRWNKVSQEHIEAVLFVVVFDVVAIVPLQQQAI